MTTKESSDKVHNAGKGRFGADQVYEGTMTYSETMRIRGYRYVDGKWVP